MKASRPTETFEAIVLQVHHDASQNKIVDAWIKGYGRMGLWARQARASKRRFGGALAPFAQLTLAAVPRDNLWQLQSVEAVHERAGIREHFATIARAANLCRVVQALWPVGEDAAGLFEGLGTALDHLTAHRTARAAGLYPRLAIMAGMMPNTTRCGLCQRQLVEPISAAHDQVLLCCRACERERPPLPDGALLALRLGRIESLQVATSIECLVAQWVSLFTGTRLTPMLDPALPRAVFEP